MSNRLTVLAGEIQDAHKAVETAQRSAVEKAREAGTKLIEAKELIRKQAGHGNWLTWLESIGLPDRTAREYMQLAGLDETNRLRVADLSLREALRAIAAPRAVSPELPLERWTPDQLNRKERAEHGECVVANMREGEDGEKRDEALLAWAEANDRLVRIDRPTQWHNPFKMPEDGNRAEVVGKFEKFYFPHKDGLLAEIPELVGKVIACWCYPEQCHGDVIATVVNEAGSTCRSPHEVANELAEQDG